MTGSQVQVLTCPPVWRSKRNKPNDEVHGAFQFNSLRIRVRNPSPCTPTREIENKNLNMITFSHVLIGGAIGVATQNPYIGFCAGVASHFVADMIPHLDVPPSAPRDGNNKLIMTPAIWTQVWVDGILAILVATYFWRTRFGFPELSPFVWGAFGGFFPDLIDNVPFWNRIFQATKFGHWFHYWHEKTHEFWEDRFPMHKYYILGVVTQLVAVGISVFYLLNA